MMGFGTSGNGGSSSPSSNLSALAPPFSVDRSNSKPTINPPVNFSEPPYALPFHSSFPNWQYSHRTSASRPDFYPNHRPEVDSIRTTCLPSSDVPNPDYCQASNPNFNPASDSFSFLQYSNGIPSKHVGEKSYYPPFVSPAIENDVPLVALNEPSYDLLSTSRAPLDGPMEVDYSDLEYMPQWDSSWNRSSDLEHGKQVGLDGSFCSEVKNIAGSNVYKNYMKQEDTSAVSSGQYVDAFGSERQTLSPSKGKLHDKVQNPRFISGDSSRTSISGSSILPESRGQGPFPKPAASFWNHQVSYNASYDMCFQPLEYCKKGSVKKSAPPLVIRPPPSLGTTRVPNAVSTNGGKNISNVTATKRKGFGFHGSFDQKEPLLQGKRGDHFFVATSSAGNEEMEYKPITKDFLDYVSKDGMEFHVADTNVLDAFTLENDNCKKAFTSVEDSPESLDHCNPSVDSPCWKGALASCFSLPEESETCGSLNPQQTQSFPPSTCDTVNSYEGNGYVELGSLLCPEKLSNTNHPVRGDEAKTGFDTPTLSCNNGVQFSNNVGKPKQDYGFPRDSVSFLDSKPGYTKELGLEKHEVTYETDSKLYAGLNTNDASNDGSVPLHGMESTSCLPCSAENKNKLPKVDAMESIPKMNVQMVVNTVHNLSELLLFYWSDDVSALSEKDHDAIKQAISNLDACISKKIPRMTPTRESRFPRQGNFVEPNLRKGVTVAWSPVTKEPDASLDSPLVDHHIYEGQSNNKSSSKKVDADIIKDDRMVQAIKEVLKEDFIGEKEIPSETLLYKNLWLEAEAALCSINYRARFNRMKIEMEQCKSDNVKETLEVAEKLLSSKVSPDGNTTQKVTPEAKDNPPSDISIQDSSVSTTTKSVDDVEASVMARLDILKCRGQSSNSEDAKGQGLATKSVDDAEASIMARLDILKRRGQCSNSEDVKGEGLTELVDVGFADKSNHFPFVGDRSKAGSLNFCDGFQLQNSGGNSKIDEFGPFISSNYMLSSNDQVIGSGREKRTGSLIFSGWCDSSSSDWEHVLKDEFSGQN